MDTSEMYGRFLIGFVLNYQLFDFELDGFGRSHHLRAVRSHGVADGRRLVLVGVVHLWSADGGHRRLRGSFVVEVAIEVDFDFVDFAVDAIREHTLLTNYYKSQHALPFNPQIKPPKPLIPIIPLYLSY